MFLSLLAWKETRLGIDDRVRSVLDAVVFSPSPSPSQQQQQIHGGDGDGISTRAFAIRHEARTGNAHTTRAAFERALAPATGALASNTTDDRGATRHPYYPSHREHHPGLWAAYVRFCSSGVGDGGTDHDRRKRTSEPRARTTARDAFYRALQRCLWSRDVYAEAFAADGGLVRDLDSAELRSVYDSLCARGLRVHVEMPGFVER